MAVDVERIREVTLELLRESERFIDSLDDLRNSSDEVEIEAQVQAHMIEIESYVDSLKDEI
jgi:DNA-binding protein H-NS